MSAKKKIIIVGIPESGRIGNNSTNTDNKADKEVVSDELKLIKPDFDANEISH